MKNHIEQLRQTQILLQQAEDNLENLQSLTGVTGFEADINQVAEKQKQLSEALIEEREKFLLFLLRLLKQTTAKTSYNYGFRASSFLIISEDPTLVCMGTKDSKTGEELSRTPSTIKEILKHEIFHVEGPRNWGDFQWLFNGLVHDILEPLEATNLKQTRQTDELKELRANLTKQIANLNKKQKST